MKRQCVCGLLVLYLGYVAQGAVISSPSVENPCQNDPTSTGTPQYLPIFNQLQLTITAAQEADTKCQVLKTALSASLSPAEVNLLESSPLNVTALYLGLNESALTSANALTRIFRHAALNVTILYNIMDRLVLNGSMQTFDQHVRNVMAAMLAVKCRVTLTTQVTESNFTTGEIEIENELLLADYDAFITFEETLSQQPMPSDEKGSIYLGYKVTHCMQLFMAVLNGALEEEKRSIQSQ